MGALRRWILHPFLFGALPVIALLAQNLTQVKPHVGLRALALALALAGGVLLGLRLVLRDWRRAAVITSLFLILFFSYGHVYSTFKETEVSGVLIGRHRFLAPLWAAGFSVLAAWAIWKLRAPGTATEALNVIGLAALTFPLIQFIAFEVRTATAGPAPAGASAQAAALHLPEDGPPPDIYYIILDAYARDDVLQEIFSYDNAPFLDRLEDLGFFVARCSLSNYAQTELSLASSLNYHYLDELGERFLPEETDRSDLAKLIRGNAVRERLRELGYTDVAFETGYYWTQIEDAAVYFSPSTSALDALEVVGGLNSFELMFLETSAALLVTDAVSVLPGFVGEAVKYPHQRHRERVLYDLDKLKSVPLNVASPKFVFAHIVAPHFPYVFGPNGEVVDYQDPMDQETYRKAYRDQLAYVNSRILPLVEEIIASSRTPPVIILQSDHGIGEGSHQDRLAILNAYHLPGVEEQDLHANISPVNTFRLVFNTYFGGQFLLLEDISRFSTYDAPYDYDRISDPRPGCP